MSEFKKVAIFIDENKIAQTVQIQESRIDYFQEIVNMYQGLNIPDPLEKNDLTALVENPRQFVARKLIKEDNLTVGGLKLSFEKVFDMVEKPQGTEELIFKIENDRINKELLINQRNAYYFEIDPENNVVLNTEYVTKTKENCTVYISTKNQQIAHDLISEIAEKINTLYALSNKNGELFQQDFFTDFLQNSYGKETVFVNPYFARHIK